MQIESLSDKPPWRLSWTYRVAIVVAVCVVSSITVLVYILTRPYTQGMLSAYSDQRRGHFEFQLTGEPAFFDGEFKRLLEERYGVKLRIVAGCIASPSLVDSARGYNDIAKPRIVRRFGKDIFKECETDAMKEPGI